MFTETIYKVPPCQFCDKEYSTLNARSNHVIRCKLNPNRLVSKPLSEEHKMKAIEKRKAYNPQNCTFCSKELKNKAALSQHEKRCKLNPNRLDMTKKRKRTKTKYFCRFCNKGFSNAHEFNKHEILCDLNPNLDFVNDYYITQGKKINNQYTKAKMLGLPKPEISEETRKRLTDILSKAEWTPERRKRHSDSMLKAVLRNPKSYAKSNRGRVKHIKKYGLVFDGSWELIFYEWCINNNVKIEDNNKFFDYVWEDKSKLYNPDFYLPEYDLYVEVKGYYDYRDICKWSHFTEKLCILLKPFISEITSGNFKIEQLLDNKEEVIKKYHSR